MQVDPQLVFNTPGWDQELLDDIGDRQVSIENSVAVHDGVAYFTNSGGLVQGWDITASTTGEPTQVFRFWTGDDTDASIVIDDEGFLYVACEYERGNARAEEVGQLLKLDPRQPGRTRSCGRWPNRDSDPGGFWATPALHDGVVIVPDNAGFVRGWDMATGAELWEFRLPGPTWQSPVVVDDVLIQGDCNGVLHALRRVRPAGAAAGAVVGEPRRLHRVDPGGVARPDLRGHPGRPVLRHRRPVNRARPASPRCGAALGAAAAGGAGGRGLFAGLVPAAGAVPDAAATGSPARRGSSPASAS